MTKKTFTTLIFIHIPKSGGSTFQSLLFRQYPAEVRFFQNHDESFQALDKLSSLSESKRKRLKLIYIGHTGFGVHKILSQSSSYITFLREPWKRTISDYFHACRNSDHSFYSRAREGATLDDFVLYRIEKQGLTNPMTRLISGINPYKPFHPLPFEALDIACDNLEHFFGIAGLTEQYDESLLIIKRFYGWRNIFYLRQNVAKVKNNVSYSPQTYELFRQTNAMDYQLYLYAKEKLGRSILEQGPDFKFKLKIFQYFNSLYQVSYDWARKQKQAIRGGRN